MDQALTDVVENARPWFKERNAEAEVVLNAAP